MRCHPFESNTFSCLDPLQAWVGNVDNVYENTTVWITCVQLNMVSSVWILTSLLSFNGYVNSSPLQMCSGNKFAYILRTWALGVPSCRVRSGWLSKAWQPKHLNFEMYRLHIACVRHLRSCEVFACGMWSIERDIVSKVNQRFGANVLGKNLSCSCSKVCLMLPHAASSPAENGFIRGTQGSMTSVQYHKAQNAHLADPVWNPGPAKEHGLDVLDGKAGPLRPCDESRLRKTEKRHWPWRSDWAKQ